MNDDDKSDESVVLAEQRAAYFGMVLSVFLAAPEGDKILQGYLKLAVLKLAELHEIDDVYEYATGAITMIAMSGVTPPHDLDQRIEQLKDPFWAKR